MSRYTSKVRIAVRNASGLLLGESLAGRLYQILYMRRYRRAGVVFVHIPRAGGTSIARAVLGKRAGHMTVAEIRQLMGASEFNQLFTFSVSRNPYSRLLSSYRFARQGGGRHGAIRQHSDYQSDQFSSFRRFVLEWLPEQDLTQVDPVFRPQWGFVSIHDVMAVDYMGKMESLTEVEAVLSERLNRIISFGHSNQSQGQGDWRSAYDDDCAKMVESLYADDFRRLGYDPDDR